MARARPRPWFRTSLLAVEDQWSGGPGLFFSVTRFGFFSRLVPPVSATPGPPLPASVLMVLTPESPYSVIPFSLQQRFHVAPGPAPPGWQGRPVPRWRGAPCQIGTATVWIRNRLLPRDFVAFPLVALFPQSDPAGPPATSALLGHQFLAQYGWRVVLDFSAIRYTTDPATNRRQLAPGCVCGRLELP
jgi:hypothetical protein